MKAFRLEGSWFERLALRRHGLGESPEKPLDIFGELRRAQKLLVLPNDRVGGVFFGGPTYYALRQRYRDAQIHLLVTQRCGGAARQVPFVDRVFTFAPDLHVWQAGFRRQVRQLQAEAYDLAICLGPDCSFLVTQLCRFSKARLRVGFHRPGDRPFNIEVVRRTPSGLEADQYRSLLRILGLEACAAVRWAIAEDTGTSLRQRYLDGRFARDHVIGLDLAAGEGRGLSRRQLDGLMGRIAELGARAVLFFSLAERRQVAYLRKTYGNRVLPFEQDDLVRVAALLGGCRALVACNTDILHLAISLGLPTVAIFDEDPRRWIPPGHERVEVVQSRDVRAVSVSQVAQALGRALAPLGPGAAAGGPLEGAESSTAKGATVE